MWWIVLPIVAILFILVISNVFVVQQSKAYVIERLGAFQSVQGGAGAGLSPPACYHQG